MATLSDKLRESLRSNPLVRRLAHQIVGDAPGGFATRRYDAARQSRRTEGWITGGSSANVEVGGSLVNLRNRSRALGRDNPHAHRYCHVMTNNIVGPGPQPSAMTGDAALDTAINSVWKAHAKRINADGTRLGANAIMWQAVFATIEAGEVLMARRPALSSDRLDIPLQVELLESDMLDHTRCESMADGSKIINGVELDPRGRVVAYHVYKDHPGENVITYSTAGATVRIPTSEIAHLYQPTRPGQRRGVPWLTSVMFAMRDLDDYRDAERLRKKTEACITAFVSGGENPADNGAEGRSIADVARDALGNIIETFEPGLIAYLTGDKRIEINRPQGVGGYNEYITAEHRGIAAGGLIPYELLTGDLSQVNYSSIRAGMLEFHRFIKVFRKTYLIPLLCDPMWEWTMEMAYVAGKVPYPVVPVEWATQKFESIDPYKEALADMETLKAGTKSLSEIIAETGRDPDDIIEEMAKVNEQLAAKNLSYEWQFPGGKAAVESTSKKKNPDLTNEEV